MHRKFIAFVLATSMAITGLSAVPARADSETARLLAGLALLGLIGAAIHDSQKDRAVTRSYSTLPARPLPNSVSRLNLPQNCLRSRWVNGRQRNLFGAGCLKNNYAFTRSLPSACQLGYWDGNRNRTGYEPVCLRERGYRFARR